MNHYAIVKLNLVGGASEFILDALSPSKNKRILSFNSSLVNCEPKMQLIFLPKNWGFNSSLVNCEPKMMRNNLTHSLTFQLLIGKLRTQPLAIR